MTPEDLDAIEARASKATAGPWVTKVIPHGTLLLRGDESAPLKERHPQGALQVEPFSDAEFIAAARENIPALVARVRELTAALTFARDALEPYSKATGADPDDCDCPQCEAVDLAEQVLG